MSVKVCEIWKMNINVPEIEGFRHAENDMNKTVLWISFDEPVILLLLIICLLRNN